MDSKLNLFTSTLMQRVLSCWDTGRPEGACAYSGHADALELSCQVRHQLWQKEVVKSKRPGNAPCRPCDLGCLSHYAIAVKSHCDEGNLRVEAFHWGRAYSSRGLGCDHYGEEPGSRPVGTALEQELRAYVRSADLEAGG